MLLVHSIKAIKKVERFLFLYPAIVDAINIISILVPSPILIQRDEERFFILLAHGIHFWKRFKQLSLTLQATKIGIDLFNTQYDAVFCFGRRNLKCFKVSMVGKIIKNGCIRLFTIMDTVKSFPVMSLTINTILQI